MDDVLLPLALALVDTAAFESNYPGCDITQADMDENGAMNGVDVQRFIQALLSN